MDDNEKQRLQLNTLQENFKFMNEKIVNIEKMVKAFDEKLDEALSKKADKWAENGVKGIYVLLIAPILVGIILMIAHFFRV